MRAVLPCVLAVLLCGLGGCGGKPGPGAEADPNRLDWKQTFEAAMDALARMDYRAFQELLTPTGRTTLEADLARFTQMLNDAVEGSRTLAKIRALWPEVPESLIAGAKAGRAEDAWTLFLRPSTPPGTRPRQAGMRMDPASGDRLQLLYRYGESSGRELPVEMLRIRGRWYVDRIALGGKT